MEPSPQEFKRLQAIFEGDGAEIRHQFILAGLLLTIFERFKDYVVQQVDGFFSHHLEIKDGDIKVTRSQEFKDLIKERGAGEPGQHGNREFRAALKWFHSLNAIDDVELKEVERLYSLRNEIGHELIRILAEDGRAPITVVDIVMAFATYLKIVQWWWKEVEAATDPDMTEEQYNNTQWDQVESTDTIILRAILQKALAGNPDWEQIQAFINQQAEANAGI